MQAIAETPNNDNLREPNANEPEPIELDIEVNENESPDSDNEPCEIYNETNENDHFIYSIQVDDNNTKGNNNV